MASPLHKLIKQENQDEDINIDVHSATPIRYVPLHHIYSATSPCRVSASGSSNVMSKKVKARRLIPKHVHFGKPPLIYCYTRRNKSSRAAQTSTSFFDSLLLRLEPEAKKDEVVVTESVEGDGNVENVAVKKQRSRRCLELSQLGVDLDGETELDAPRSTRKLQKVDYSLASRSRRRKNSVDDQRNSVDDTQLSASTSSKKWVWLDTDKVDPQKFIGLHCKVYWPLDADWYSGSVDEYNSETGRHHVKYSDGDAEDLILSKEKINFYISQEEMERYNLRSSVKCMDTDDLDYSELLVLAASLNDCEEIEPGDIVWAKLAGHAVWPAIVVEESMLVDRKGLNKPQGGKSLAVQFFGSHDFARIGENGAISFLTGLISSYHLKCKQPRFRRSMEEAKQYLSEQKLPKRMLQLRNGTEADDSGSVSGEDDGTIAAGEDSVRDESIQKALDGLTSKCSKRKSTSRISPDSSVGYRPVRVDWKDLDKCNVCHMDEEYETNLFLQCDKCRMMVHARCYGELEHVDGVLWFCNLCRPDAPDSPPCSLCPVIGGAMKPTTDGRWAHLACAIWIPETCLSDIKRMEPIDGVNRISKDRWKLLCSICGVPYGACIQCSNPTCRVAYHPLCARAAGYCVELEDEDRLHLISVDDDEDEEEQCIKLLSFCKKHRLPSTMLSVAGESIGQITSDPSNYIPPLNPSGCARTEPYNYSRRRGRKEPEALAAASLKRLFVENRPHLVKGFSHHESFTGPVGSKLASYFQRVKASQLDAPKSMLSMAEKYTHMKETSRKRLTFGKSGIHGFGIFAKHPHRAGDMVIEYTGELVRPTIADRRERLIYNSLVGAGTYMFRINDDRVIDATRAGSLAHLINHSCEPNCYSRTIGVNGDLHIIIFAKRDIKQWEELTYDYRFSSIDERLACYCGFPRCRHVVNDIESEQEGKKYVPRCELTDCMEE